LLRFDGKRRRMSMVSTWWLVAAFFAGVGAASLLFVLMQLAGDSHAARPTDERRLDAGRH
jgi:hypothetical protein